MIPQDLLDTRAPRCGLNADWFAQTWHLGPSDSPNNQGGDYYITDLEDGSDADAYALVQRFYRDGDNDEINTIAEGSAEAMLTVAFAMRIGDLPTTDNEGNALSTCCGAPRSQCKMLTYWARLPRGRCEGRKP